jgi:hypothetical protein
MKDLFEWSLRDPWPGDMYTHFKGGQYEVVDRALMEATLEPYIVYRGVDGRVWIRPLDEFRTRFSVHKR